MFVRLEAREDDGRSGGFEVCYLAIDASKGSVGVIEAASPGWIRDLINRRLTEKDWQKYGVPTISTKRTALTSAGILTSK